MAHPGTLTALAMDALGTHIYNLCSRLILPIIVKSPNIGSKKRRLSYNREKLISQINVVSKCLEDLLINVPANIANELTNRFLDNIDNWDYEIGKCRYMFEEEMLEKFVSSLIHPAVTRIEPPQDLLDCSYIFPETVFCSAMCVKVILKSAQSLKKLRALHIIHSRMKCDFSEIVLPIQLVEFSGRCNNEGLAKIAKSCPNLKYVNVFGSKGMTNVSVDVFLNMKHLEKLNIVETKISSKGVKRLTEGLSNRPEKLKYLALSLQSIHCLEILKTLPKLEISLQLRSMPGNIYFQMPELFTFQNIRGLQIRCTLDYLNELLKEIGRQLVYLDAEVEYFGPQNYSNEDSNLKVSEVLQVGQYCSSLKCLHIEITYYNFSRLKNFTEKPLPGFQSICCLTLEIKHKLKETDFLNFLISQCVSVKKVMLSFNKHEFNMYGVISDLIALGFLKHVEVIYFQPFCPRCSVRHIDDNDVYDQNVVHETVKSLIASCPNLRVVGGVHEFTNIYPHNSQRLKFVPSLCRCK